jgi:O-antigen/teichoic acid export membrane protein
LGAVVSGAVVNLALNAWAIPKFGALGAAWSTVASQAIASGLSLLLSLGLMRARRDVR